MYLTIDRIEDGIAILIGQDDETLRLTVPVALLPAGPREGDVITLSLERDDAATAAARERVSRLLETLKKKP